MPAPLSTDARLLAYLAGALEPGPHLDVEALLTGNSELQARLSVLSAMLRADPLPDSRWRIPPPGVRVALSAAAHPVAVMGNEGVLPGDRVEVHLDSDAAGTVVVLYLGEEDWSVVYPTSPEEQVSMGELPCTSDGQKRLDLVAGQETGRQRWAVAVIRHVDWSVVPDIRWEPLREGIARGEVPIASLDLEVAA